MPDLPEEAVEEIPGLKQGRDACDVAFHGHGKSLEDAFALGLAIAAPAIRKPLEDECEHLRKGIQAQRAEAERLAAKLRQKADDFNRAVRKQVGEVRAERDQVERELRFESDLRIAEAADREKVRKQERERYREAVYQELSAENYLPDHFLIDHLDNVDAALDLEDSDA